MYVRLKIDVYDRYFKLSTKSMSMALDIQNFGARFITTSLQRVGRGRFIPLPDKVFAYKNKTKTEYRFFITVLNDFLLHWKNIGHLEPDITYHPSPEVDKYKWKVKSDKTPRENQPIVIEYGMKPQPSRLVDLQTGKGKTFCAFWLIQLKQVPVALFVRKNYMPIWYDEAQEFFELKPHELMKINGTKKLIALQKRIIERNKLPKFTVFSINTMLNYVKNYYGTEDHGYLISPEAFLPRLGVGFKVVDEAHELFHANFLINLFMHYKEDLNLSASVNPSNKDLVRIYEMVYPYEMRCPKIPYDKFIHVYEITYSLQPESRLKYRTPGMQTYNHNLFEESIMKDGDSLASYLSVMRKTIDALYHADYKQGERLLVLCASKAFCRLVAEVLRDENPTLTVTTYIEGDDSEVLKEFDIIVSTRQSAGTGVDIKGLKLTVLSVAVDSRQSNEQSLGRTRKNPDFECRFAYLTCTSISKHVEYSKNKRLFFADKVHSHEKIDTAIVV